MSTATSPSRSARNSQRAAPPFALVGPTASGKTVLSIELAKRLGAEILVVDSMTVYRGMDIGTAKPTAAQRALVPHHLLDVADPAQPFSVAAFQGLARAALEDLAARGVPALLVGGSGLYLRSVVDELRFPGTDAELRAWLELEGRALGPEHMHQRLAAFDPTAASRIEPGNVRRTVRALEVAALTGIPFSQHAQGWEDYPPERMQAVGLQVPPEKLALRIEERVRRMVSEGLVEEVRALLDRGAGAFLTSSQAIGYLEVVRHLQGELSIDEVIEGTVRRTKHLARRQMAWFRRDPRIQWVEEPDVDQIEELLQR